SASMRANALAAAVITFLSPQDARAPLFLEAHACAPRPSDSLKANRRSGQLDGKESRRPKCLHCKPEPPHGRLSALQFYWRCRSRRPWSRAEFAEEPSIRAAEMRFRECRGAGRIRFRVLR